MLVRPAIAMSRGKRKGVPKVAAAPQLDLTPQGLINDWQKKQMEAKAANETRYSDILAGYNAQNEASKQAYGDMKSMYDQNYTATQGAYADILKGYNDRYGVAMGNLNNAGAQAAADINDGALAQGAAVQQNLVSSGLAGTTIAPTMQMGVERERNNSQGRLQEQLRQERLSTQAGLSGDVLRAKEMQLAGLDRQRNDMLTFQQQQQQMQSGLTKGMLDFKERREDTYPELSQYAAILEKIGAGGMGGAAGGGGVVGGGGGVAGGGTVAQRPTVNNNNGVTDMQRYNDYVTNHQRNTGASGSWGARPPMTYSDWLRVNKPYGSI